MQNPPIRGNKQNQQQNRARSIVHVYANHKHGAATSASRSFPRPQGGFTPLRRGAWHPRSPSSSSRGGDDLHRRMFAWQGGGQRRRFVPRKEPIKTSGTSFSPTDFRRTNAWRQARDLEQKDRPLKQPAISLRPGSYGEREDSRGGVSRIGRPDLWSLFMRVSFFVFPSTFFFVFLRRRERVHAHQSRVIDLCRWWLTAPPPATPVARIFPRAAYPPPTRRNAVFITTDAFTALPRIAIISVHLFHAL